jgi:hypothetical protein
MTLAHKDDAIGLWYGAVRQLLYFTFQLKRHPLHLVIVRATARAVS